MPEQAMPKTSHLAPTELAALRAAVLARFLERRPRAAAELKISTFKPAYEDLCGDIAEAVEGGAMAVSTNRLRKFFYYTDDSLCRREQKEEAVFGEDFLKVLEEYTAHDPGHPPVSLTEKGAFSQKTDWKRLATLLSAAVAVAAAAVFFLPKKPVGWVEHFSKTDLESLQKNGWEIRDYCDSCWKKQLMPDSMLTLWTERGDYLLDDADSAKVPNMLIHKIGLKRFSVVVMLSKFLPTREYQQAGVHLFNREPNVLGPHIRLTYVGGDGGVVVQSITKQNTELQGPIHGLYEELKGGDRPTDVYLMLKYREGKVEMFAKRVRLNAMFQKIGETEIDFVPKYLGVSAFRGVYYADHKNNRRPINTHPSIPALIDFVRVDPLPD